MGAVLRVWGWGRQSPEANGGLGAKPQLLEARGSGGGASSARKFYIFLQNEPDFRAILIGNNAFTVERGIEIGSPT